MKKYYIAVLALFMSCMTLSLWSAVYAETNPYAAGYNACQSKYKIEDGADNTEYTQCIAKAKCTVDNPGQTAYCDCIGNGGVKLNTDVPFIGRCINKNDTQNAFPSLIGGLSKMVVTAILIVSFMFIIAGGVQRASGDPKEWKAKIVKVAIWLAILWASGAILALINPNFFR